MINYKSGFNVENSDIFLTIDYFCVKQNTALCISHHAPLRMLYFIMCKMDGVPFLRHTQFIFFNSSTYVKQSLSPRRSNMHGWLRLSWCGSPFATTRRWMSCYRSKKSYRRGWWRRQGHVSSLLSNFTGLRVRFSDAFLKYYLLFTASKCLFICEASLSKWVMFFCIWLSCDETQSMRDSNQ